MTRQIIVRAFELARSGLYPTLGAVRSQMKLEGFPTNEVEPHLSGKLIQKQLREAIAIAREKDIGSDERAERSV